VIIRVAAVNHRVAGIEQRDEVREDLIDQGRGNHHPDGPGLVQFSREIPERRRPDCPFGSQYLREFRMDVVYYALMSGPEQAPHHVAAHPAQPDHSHLHGLVLAEIA
jgi:hypothetical protein